MGADERGQPLLPRQGRDAVVRGWKIEDNLDNLKQLFGAAPTGAANDKRG